MFLMHFFSYIKEALSPGGTPKRYLIWVCIVLLIQTISSLFPSPGFFSGSWNDAHSLALVVAVIVIAVQFVRNDTWRNYTSFALYVVGLVVSTITISTGTTSLSGIIFMLTWAMTMFVAERREYISFDSVTAFMVLMLISTVILLLHHPDFEQGENNYVLLAGALLTAVNIYLVYIDFGKEKNFYQKSRKVYADLQELSTKMSEILSSEGKLDHLLRKVSKECIPLLDLEDCVIYLYDEDKKILVQTAAYGNKSVNGTSIANPIDLQPGEGIVGRCFEQGVPVLVKETKNDPHYIVDDAFRNAELAVPIVSNGKVVGVIDSEHSQKGYFKTWHVQAFTIIASFCGIKITEYMARESIEQARVAQEETEMYKELDELKNRFITNISHDLKTPLSLIKGPAIQIAEESKEPATKKLAQYVLKNAEHLLRVVNQLLQLNRVDKGLNELYLEEVHVDAVLSKITAQYEGLAQQRRITLSVQCVPVVFTTDVFRLEQIIHNLLHNAFRYSTEGGVISINVTCEDPETLSLQISDSGKGIPDNLKDKVFERFFKVDVNNHEGTGIGLSLVKEYVQSIGGNIRLDNAKEGGACFTVRLPILVATANGSKVSTDVDELHEETVSKPIMVVVEDHPDLNNFICDFFEERFQCYQCFDGAEGIQRIAELQPDIVISDLMMPNTDGRAMIASLKENDLLAHIPVVVLTAKGQTESKIDLYETGAENYVVKPFDIKELNAIVTAILEQRQRLKMRFRERFFVPKDEALPEEMATNDFIEQAVHVIYEQLDNASFSIADLSGALAMGRNKLQKEVRELTGLTPVEFIRSVRLLEAKKRILETNATISEIAFSVGFNNLSYFTRSFKAEFDVLPTDVRN